eukprot:g237.t1
MAKKRKAAFQEKDVDINYLIASVKGNHFIGLLEGEQSESEKKYGVHKEFMKANSTKARKNANSRRMKRLKLTPAQEERRREAKRMEMVERELETAANLSGERMPEGNLAGRVQRRKERSRQMRQQAKDARLLARKEEEESKRTNKTIDELRLEKLEKKKEKRRTLKDLVSKFEEEDKRDILDDALAALPDKPYDPQAEKKKQWKKRLKKGQRIGEKVERKKHRKKKREAW